MSNPTPEPRTEHQDDTLQLREVTIRRLHLRVPYGTAPAGQWWYEPDVRPVIQAYEALDARHAEEIAAKDKQIADATKASREAEDWADAVSRGQAPCGHWKAYSYCEEPRGAVIDCWQCRAEKAEAELTTLREQLAAYKAENAEVRRIAAKERAELAAVADAAEARRVVVQQALSEARSHLAALGWSQTGGVPDMGNTKAVLTSDLLDDLITTSEAAKIMDCGPENVRVLIRRGAIPIVAKVGRGQSLLSRQVITARAQARRGGLK